VAYDSVTTWRLYSAEQSVPLGVPLLDVAAARGFVRKVRRSRWWRENVQDDARITVHLGGSASDEAIWSYAQPNVAHLPSRWTISIHPEMLNDLVLLHELAHCIAPRWEPSPRPRRKDTLPGHVQLPFHAAGFAGAMAELVREFGAGAAHDDLRAAYEHFDVPVMTLDEYRSAVSDSLRAEADLAAFDKEAEAHWGVTSRAFNPGVIPRWRWGDVLMMMRYRSGRERRRLSQEAIAKLVSRVERCTRHDIGRVEKSETLPDDPRLKRIAMCYAVALNLDPIYARHRMGLVRWDCGVELDELRAINPDWVELVETMNRQLEQRPPRWVVEGER
jgi:transcriptional regulator with XRE-family HTH domain